MPRQILLLVVASALAHATWNAILKRSRDPENAVVGMSLVAGLSAVLVAFAVHVPAPPRASLGWCVVSGVLEAGYFVTLARALARAPLGSVYTVVRGGALVVVWPVSIALLGEPLTLARLGGTALVALGLAATGAGERKPVEAGLAAEAGAQTVRSGLLFAVVCALFVGGYHLAYKLALSNGGRAEAMVAISLSIASFINIGTLGQRRARVIAAVRLQPVRILVAGLLGNVGFLLFLIAMKDVGAGVVLTLRNTSILFAQVLAIGMGERPRPLGIAGAALVTGGAVLLAM